MSLAKYQICWAAMAGSNCQYPAMYSRSVGKEWLDPKIGDYQVPSMSELSAVLQANHSYSQNFGTKGSLPLTPARKFAILTCMDARLDPAGYAGLREGDAHVIRNAGGRASDDAIRSLVISYKLLGTEEWYVIHHSNCGMEFFSDESIRSLLSQSLETAVLGANGFEDVGEGPGSAAGDYINWLTISNNEKSVVEDVRRIREHPLVPWPDSHPWLHLPSRYRPLSGSCRCLCGGSPTVESQCQK